RRHAAPRLGTSRVAPRLRVRDGPACGGMCGVSGTKVLRNARPVRLDGDGYDALREHAASAIPELVDVAIADGRITAVGPRLDARGDEEVDLDGRWLMPGLWDNHVHMTQWALDRK